MSRRVMSILEYYTPNIEIYSIDEAFLKFNNSKYFDIVEESYKMRKQINQWTGIPVSIGLAPTKSLAKIANKIAKKFNTKTLGVYSLDNQEKTIKALKWTPVEDVWGIGRRQSKLLRSIGIKNAFEFTSLSDQWVKKNMSVVGLRLKKDLSGSPFIKLEEIRSKKKSIATTRSFESKLTLLTEVEERISTFATSCAEKLRKQNGYCTSLLVFLRSDPFKKDGQYSNSLVVNLPYSTNSSLIISKQAVFALRKIFKPGIAYKKAGVLVLDIKPKENRQLNLFESNIAGHDKLMKAIDNINYKYGGHQIKLGNQDLNRVWKMKQEKLSPKFTTLLNEIIKVK